MNACMQRSAASASIIEGHILHCIGMAETVPCALKKPSDSIEGVVKVHMLSRREDAGHLDAKPRGISIARQIC